MTATMLQTRHFDELASGSDELMPKLDTEGIASCSPVVIPLSLSARTYLAALPLRSRGSLKSAPAPPTADEPLAMPSALRIENYFPDLASITTNKEIEEDKRR